MDTHLQVTSMQNVLEESVVLMDQKVKDEVDHQLKSEFEISVQECMIDQMKTMEDRMLSKMKKFEKIIKNATTTGSYNVTSATHL